jgi:hypothetical protein
MAEKEKPILVYIRLGDVKVAANKWYQDRIDDIIQEFEKYLGTLLRF